MMYSIIVEFECNRWEDDLDTDDAESYHSTSEEEYLETKREYEEMDKK